MSDKIYSSRGASALFDNEESSGTDEASGGTMTVRVSMMGMLTMYFLHFLSRTPGTGKIE